MAARATVLADSRSPANIRLITFLVVFARIVLAEVNTHRMLCRNYASTRAIPLAVQLYNVLTDPFIPEKFGVNQPGMQAFRHLEGMQHDQAVELWLAGRDRAVTTVLELILGPKVTREVLFYVPNQEYVSSDVLLAEFEALKALLPKSTDDNDPAASGILNVHKQLAGRVLEPWLYVEGIITATELDNFFALRDHPAAQGEIAELARAMREAMDNSEPRVLQPGEWHLPLVDEDEQFETVSEAIQSSAARCAAVSYKRQHAKNPEREQVRYRQLVEGGHMSPLEHQATPFFEDEWKMRRHMALAGRASGEELGLEQLMIEQASIATELCGPLRGWRSHRKDIASEDNFGLVRKG